MKWLTHALLLGKIVGGAVLRAAGPATLSRNRSLEGSPCGCFMRRRKAAEQGLVEAQYSLGLMYANGNGAPEDKVLAYMWWNLAAAQEFGAAKENKGIIQDSMTSAQIEEAQTLSRECLAKDYKHCG